MLIEGINKQLIADAISSHDPLHVQVGTRPPYSNLNIYQPKRYTVNKKAVILSCINIFKFGS